ncbi:hypothetical protein BGW39_000512 [Mortierella sp. 14UC]|nr:hypothetical protein BGW39_000512 [Mortierella sp. 14UC]
MAPAREILFAVLAAAGLLGLVASFIGVKLDDPPPQHKSPITGFPTWHQDYETLHNLLEVALLIVLQSGGRVTGMNFGLYMFVYVCITILLSVYLPWPLDAIFFRWQGLCSDFGLIVMFVRMHKSTKAQLDTFGDPDSHDLQLAKAQKAADHLAQQQQQSGFSASSGSLHTVHLSPANGETPSSGLPTANPSSSPLHNIHAHWKRFVARAPSPSSGDDSDNETLLQNHRQQNTNAALTPESTHTARFGGEAGHTVIQVLPTDGGRRVSVVALNQDEAIWGVKWKNPDQILLLIAASVFHVIGNCVTTIFVTSLYAMAAFHVSYGIAYPLYAYYLYVDNHALRQTKIYMPKFTKVKNYTYLFVAMIGATATVRAGLFVATLNAEGKL